jgi:4-hydroxybenzoyl-CoA thioesterase
MFRNRIEVEIEWGDCDPADIVYYPNFFRWFNRGAHKLFDAVGLPFHELIKDRDTVGVPLLDARATFLAPVRFGDVVTVTSWIEEWRNKSFVVGHQIHNKDVLSVEGQEIRAWVRKDPDKPNGLRAVPIPDDIKRRFASR